MKTVLLTGGSGFFGGILKEKLLARGDSVVNVDLERDELAHPRLVSVRGDIRDRGLIDRLFSERRFDAVLHCAAVLAHESPDPKFLWSSNVEGTRTLAEAAKKHGVRRFVFTSTNCLWAKNFHRPIREDDAPEPVEAYGKSKWEAEKLLSAAAAAGDLDVVILRTPTIMDSGRLGLLAILYEFIYEGRKVWVVGGGKNRYQFVYAGDLADAHILAMESTATGVFNAGSDDVKTFRTVYESVVARAATGARVASLPRALVIPAMKVLHKLKLSPLGPYQYKMIAEDAEFDTSKIKAQMGWHPTLTNEEMLWKAYEYYAAHRDEILSRKDASAHRRAAKMGAIRILKWIS